MNENTNNAHGWWVMLAVSFVLLMTNVDFTVANIALAPIAQSFHTSLGTVKWVVIAYAISTGVFMTIGGRLGDVFGLKKIYLLGISLFTFFSLLCAMASSIQILIIGRCLQGIGVALCFPLCFAFIATSFNEKNRAFALGIGNAIAGFTLAAGPSLGGFILHYLSWHWFFIINLPLGILSIILGLIIIPTTKTSHSQSLDIPSILAYVISVFLMMTAINNLPVGETAQINLFYITLISGILLFIIFIIMQHYRKAPLLATDLLTNIKFLNCNALRFIIQYIFFGSLILFSLYFENILGYSMVATGALLLVCTATYGLSAPLGSLLITRLGAKLILMLAMLVSGLSCLYFIFSAAHPATFNLIIALILLGMSIGIISTATETEALGIFPAEQAGAAAGLFFTIVVLSGAVGASITSFNIVNLSHNFLLSGLSSLPHDITNFKMLIKFAEGSYPLRELTTYIPNATPQLKTLLYASFNYAFKTVMWIYFVLSMVGICLSLFLKKKMHYPQI